MGSVMARTACPRRSFAGPLRVAHEEALLRVRPSLGSSFCRRWPAPGVPGEQDPGQSAMSSQGELRVDLDVVDHRVLGTGSATQAAASRTPSRRLGPPVAQVSLASNCRPSCRSVDELVPHRAAGVP